MPTREQLGLPMGHMTVAELAAYSGRGVREIIDYAFGEGGRNDDTMVSTPSRVDTRTAAGRYAYDQAVFGALEGNQGAMTAQEIRACVGGTADQIRASLTRLLEDDILTAKGQGNATRYELLES
jgi:predicted HTH transcriptional regulator